MKLNEKGNKKNLFSKYSLVLQQTVFYQLLSNIALKRISIAWFNKQVTSNCNTDVISCCTLHKQFST